MDLTQCFFWITGIGAVIGLIAAIQQLLQHGWRPFIRAVAVAVVIGWALVLIYPTIRAHTVGGALQVALAGNTAPAEVTPVVCAPLDHAAVSPPAVDSAPPATASRLAEAAPDAPAAPDRNLPGPTTASPAPPAGASKSSETAPLKPAASYLTTISSTVKVRDATPAKPAPMRLAPVEVIPAKAAPTNSTPANRAPINSGAAQPARIEAVGFKPVLPAFLPPQHRLFWPAEVAYCPACSAIYSSQGPAFGVTCPHCGEKVNLVSNPNYMVHMCGKCGTWHRTTYFPSAAAPHYFRYYCPVCNEYHWFPN